MSRSLELERSLVEHARALGFLACHFRPAKTAKGWRTAIVGDAGFPDVVICGHGALLFVECKGKGQTTTKDQDRWLKSLRDFRFLGAEIEVSADPSRWPSGRYLRPTLKVGPFKVMVCRPEDFDNVLFVLNSIRTSALKEGKRREGGKTSSSRDCGKHV